MSRTTTIQIPAKLKKKLQHLKMYPNESYASVIERLLEIYRIHKEDFYFIQEAQKKKMEELWDNDDDDAWNNV